MNELAISDQHLQFRELTDEELAVVSGGWVVALTIILAVIGIVVAVVYGQVAHHETQEVLAKLAEMAAQYQCPNPGITGEDANGTYAVGSTGSGSGGPFIMGPYILVWGA